MALVETHTSTHTPAHRYVPESMMNAMPEIEFYRGFLTTGQDTKAFARLPRIDSESSHCTPSPRRRRSQHPGASERASERASSQQPAANIQQPASQRASSEPASQRASEPAASILQPASRSQQRASEPASQRASELASQHCVGCSALHSAQFTRHAACGSGSAASSSTSFW